MPIVQSNLIKFSLDKFNTLNLKNGVALIFNDELFSKFEEIENCLIK